MCSSHRPASHRSDPDDSGVNSPRDFSREASPERVSSSMVSSSTFTYEEEHRLRDVR